VKENGWVSFEANSLRRACSNNVTGFQGHQLADVGNGLRDRKDHVAGIPLLKSLTIDAGRNVEILWIADFIHHQRGTPWRKGVKCLSG